MRFLIDTQVVIWSLVDIGKIPNHIKLLLQENVILVSQTSLFEIAIKQKINKLPELEVSIDEILERLEKDGFQILAIQNKHISTYHQIPLHEDHRDPFDRLLLATALFEQIPIISADEKFEKYEALVEIIWKMN